MYEIYTVMPGDSIESIANSFNITPANLYALNGFSPDYIVDEGQNIIVPKVENAFFSYYTVKKGDNLYQIAKDYGVNEKLLATLNGLNLNDYIYPNQTIVVPQKNVSVYITEEGDTINEIASGMNANINILLRENPRIFVLPEQIIVYKEKN